MNKKKVLFIANPYAGKKKIQSSLYVVVDCLNRGGYITTVRLTEESGHATKIASEVKADEYDIIVCAGGDGTLNEVVSGVLKSKVDIPIGYIPTGSTNDFASTLGISKDIRAAANDIISGYNYKIDMGLFDDRVFSYVASFGIFTKASYATDRTIKNLLGRTAYLFEGVKDLTDVHEHKMRILVDDKEIEDTFIFGAVANSTSLGGVLTIDPQDVCLDDGKFEYLFIKKPTNLAEVVKAIYAITSYDYKSDQLYFGSAKKLTFFSNQPLDWSLDGEKATAGEELHISNLHNAVTLILPNSENKLFNVLENSTVGLLKGK